MNPRIAVRNIADFLSCFISSHEFHNIIFFKISLNGPLCMQNILSIFQALACFSSEEYNRSGTFEFKWQPNSQSRCVIIHWWRSSHFNRWERCAEKLLFLFTFHVLGYVSWELSLSLAPDCFYKFQWQFSVCMLMAQLYYWCGCRLKFPTFVQL